MAMSIILQLGTKAPNFELTNVVTGDTVSINDFADKKALLIVFLCAHCPFVLHVKDEIAKIAKEYSAKSLGIAAISSNDINTHPQDGPEGLRMLAENAGYDFPVLYDETQEVAKVYTAVCTPDFFLFDSERSLVYRGQLDDSRPGNNLPLTGKDLRAAIEAVLSDQNVSQDQKPSTGCGIKWKPGNEPNY